MLISFKNINFLNFILLKLHVENISLKKDNPMVFEIHISTFEFFLY